MANAIRNRFLLQCIGLILLILAAGPYLACLHCGDDDSCCDDPIPLEEIACQCACVLCFVNDHLESPEPGYAVAGSAFLQDPSILAPDIVSQHFRPPRITLG